MADQFHTRRLSTRQVARRSPLSDRPTAAAPQMQFSHHPAFLAVLLACAVGTGLLVVWKVFHRQAITPGEKGPKVLANHLGTAPMSPEEKSQMVIAELLAFVNAPSHEQRAGIVYDKAKALEHLTDYYERRGNKLPERIINPSVNALMIRGRELLLVAFTDQGGRGWTAPFEEKGGSYLLHWEAMVGFGEISWLTFFAEHPAGHFLMRASFILPENDTPSLSGKDRVMIQMRHPNLKYSVYVSLNYGSKIYQELKSFPKLAEIPAIVEIYWPEGEVEVPHLSRWIQRDWIE